MQIEMKKYPLNRDYDAIYTIKIPNPQKYIGQQSTTSITTLSIKLPAEIEESNLGLSCYPLSQMFNENYLSLMIAGESTGLECGIENGIISVLDVQSVLGGLDVDDFLRIAFFKFKNPDLSTNSQKL